MWLIIRKSDNAVIGTSYIEPPENSWNLDLYEIKEWDGGEPPLHLPDEGIESYDPTLEDPDYPAFQEAASDFRALRDAVVDELGYLDEIIPTIDTMTLEELRAAFKRSEQRDRQLLRALRYVFRRLL